MREQKLTISGLYRPGWPRWPQTGQVAYLPLAGAWLAEAGFPVGARVVVEVVDDGELVVRRVEDAGAGRPAGRVSEAGEILAPEPVHA